MSSEEDVEPFFETDSEAYAKEDIVKVLDQISRIKRFVNWRINAMPAGTRTVRYLNDFYEDLDKAGTALGHALMEEEK